VRNNKKDGKAYTQEVEKRNGVDASADKDAGWQDKKGTFNALDQPRKKRGPRDGTEVVGVGNDRTEEKPPERRICKHTPRSSGLKKDR